MSETIDRQSAAQERMARRHGIATVDELRRGPRRYDWNTIERDTLVLLERDEDLPAGSTRDAIPQSLVNYMANIYLSCCYLENRAPSQNLVHLIAQQLGIRSFGLKGRDRNTDALSHARDLRVAEPTISNRTIARTVGVPVSTVGRWVASGELIAKEGVAPQK